MPLAGRPEATADDPVFAPVADGLFRAGLPIETSPPVPAPVIGGSTGHALAPTPRPAGNAAPVPELATTGALPSILAVGALALVAVSRLHRWKMRRSQG